MLLPVTVVLTLAYVSGAFALAGVLCGLHMAHRRAVVIGFTAFGLTSGTLAAWVWPLDSATSANLYAVVLGDQVYHWAIRWFGDPHAAQAHDTIPWLLRVPQVYALAGAATGAVAGWIAGKVSATIALVVRRRRHAADD